MIGLGLTHISFFDALWAGMRSFVSHCTLSVFFPYLFIVACGALFAVKRHLLFSIGTALLFLVGFSAEFVVLGATSTNIGAFFLSNAFILAKIGGALILAYGVSIVFMRFSRVGGSVYTLAAAFIIGVFVAIGWRPCADATLGQIYSLAGGSETAVRGSTLLLVYIAGLDIPLLLLAIPIAVFLKTKRQNTIGVRFIVGGLVIAVGIMLLFNL